jgi:hypothetical protein
LLSACGGDADGSAASNDADIVQCRGEFQMRPSKILEKLQGAIGEEAEAALSSELRDESHAIGMSLVRIWQGSDADLADRALGVLYEIAEPAIVPLVVESSRMGVEDRVQAMTLAVENELALRRRLVAGLEEMLDDKSPLAIQPPGAPTEREVPRRRVCDEAYLLMRALVHLGEEELAAITDADDFLALPDEGRDDTISEARRSQVWNRLLEDAENDED